MLLLGFCVLFWVLVGGGCGWWDVPSLLGVAPAPAPAPAHVTTKQTLADKAGHCQTFYDYTYKKSFC